MNEDISNLVGSIAGGMEQKENETRQFQCRTPEAASRHVNSVAKDLTNGSIRTTEIDPAEIFNILAERLENIGATVEWNYGKTLGIHNGVQGWYDNQWGEVGREATFKVSIENCDGKEFVFIGHPNLVINSSYGYTANDFASDFVPQSAWDRMAYQFNAYFTKVDPRTID